jgi:glycosyltransferase involved in cell wall biosynthesis
LVARVLHVSSVHAPYDSRIFVRECRSLAAAGYDVTLATPGSHGSDVKDGVRLVSLTPVARRWERPRIWREILSLAMSLRPAIVHFHDPELVPLMMLLARPGRCVICDVHEDLPYQVLTKDWIPPRMRGIVGRLACLLARAAESSFTVILAADSLQRRFRQPHLVVHNYVDLPWFDRIPRPDRRSGDAPLLVYCGGVGVSRGVLEMLGAVAALTHAEAQLQVIGRLEPPHLRDRVEREIRRLGLHDRVLVTGFLRITEAIRMVKGADVGLCLLHPQPNYKASFPIKLTEYMAAGIPIVASDFTLWRQIVEGAGCGLLVDPLDTQMIAVALDYVLAKPEWARELGRNGRRAAEECYNWGSERQKLLGLYESLLS